MFRIASSGEIGEYITELVMQKYSSQRQFCIEWMKKDHTPIYKDEIDKRTNKFSQIKKGKKGIQTADLPVFCDLLDTTCEAILSAGKYSVPQVQRVTNYSIAHCSDEKIWKEYVERSDKLILNADEYGKTVLDYAIEFKNINLIVYLLEKGYIWFDGENCEKLTYSMNFGAGTNIEKREHIINGDYYLDLRLRNPALRAELIALAIETNNLKVLKELKANEIPDYYSSAFSYPKYSLNSIKDYFQESHTGEKTELSLNKIFRNIGKAADNVAAYFTDSFNVEDQLKRNHEYVYYYISEVLDSLVEHNNTYTETALEKAIEYNEETLRQAKEQIADNIEVIRKDYDNASVPFTDEIKSKHMAKCFDSYDYNIDETEKILRVESYNIAGIRRGNLVRNIIHVSKKSKNERIQKRINKINALHDSIVNLKDEYVDVTAKAPDSEKGEW